MQRLRWVRIYMRFVPSDTTYFSFRKAESEKMDRKVLRRNFHTLYISFVVDIVKISFFF